MSDNHYLRELKSIPFHEQNPPDEFRDFAEVAVLPSISITGYKRQAKRDLAINVLHHLVTTGLMNQVVADSRDTGRSGIEARKKIWNEVIAAGYAICCKGSESSGKRSRFQATDRLLSLQFHWALSILQDHPPRDLVFLHTGRYDLDTKRLLPPEDKKQPISITEHVTKRAQRGPDGKPDPRAITNGLAHWQGVERAIDAINSENLNHAWLARNTIRGHAYQPNVALRQIHVGEMFRGARFYSWGRFTAQSMRKVDRRAMLIDGEPTAELDFSCMHPRLLYHFAKIEPEGDVYRPELVFPKYYQTSNATDNGKALIRKFVKSATNRALNATSQQKANGSIWKLVNEHPKEKFIWKVLKYDGMEPQNVVERIAAVHPDINHHFFTQTIFELMTLDSKIMAHILQDLTSHGIPALGIHDSIVCKASDAHKVKESMADQYKLFVNFLPQISQDY